MEKLIQTKKIYGYTYKKYSEFYQLNNYLIYLAGNNIVLNNIDTKEQKIFSTEVKQTNPKCITMSQNKNYIAIAQQNDNSPSLELQSQTRSKKLQQNPNSVKFDNTDLTDVVTMRFFKSDTVLLVLFTTKEENMDSLVIFRLHGSYNFYSQHQVPVKGSGPCALLPNQFEPERNQFMLQEENQISFWFLDVAKKSFKLDDTVKELQDLANISCVCYQEFKTLKCFMIAYEPKKIAIFDSSFVQQRSFNTDQLTTCMAQYKKFMVLVNQFNVCMSVQDKNTKVFEKWYDFKIYNKVQGLSILHHASSVVVFEEYKTICMGTTSGSIFVIDSARVDKESKYFDVGMLQENQFVERIDQVSLPSRKKMLCFGAESPKVQLLDQWQGDLYLEEFQKIPQKVLIHPFGFQLVIAFYKDIEIYNILVKDLRLVYTIASEEPLLDFLISKSGKWLICLYENLIRVIDFFTMQSDNYLTFPLPRGMFVSSMCLNADDSMIYFLDDKNLQLNVLKLSWANKDLLNPDFCLPQHRVFQDETNAILSLQSITMGNLLLCTMADGTILMVRDPFTLKYITEAPAMLLDQKPALVRDARNGWLVCSSHEHKGQVMVFKEQDISGSKPSIYWLQPGQSQHVKDIQVSSVDNKIYTLCTSGLVVEYELMDPNLKDMYKDIMIIDEQLINKNFLMEIEQDKSKIHENQEKEKRLDEEKFKQLLIEKEKFIKDLGDQHKLETTKLDDYIFELKQTNSSIEVKHEERIKQLHAEHAKKIKVVENKLEEVHTNLNAQIKTNDADKEKQISEKNAKQRSLSNNYVELIKKISTEYNLKINEKDKKIQDKESDYAELMKTYNATKESKNAEVEKSYQKGIDESKNQMLFLTDETIKAKSLLSEYKQKLESKDKEISDVNKKRHEAENKQKQKEEEAKMLDELIKQQEKQLFLMDFKLSESDKKIADLESVSKDLEKQNWDAKADIESRAEELNNTTTKLKEANEVKEKQILDQKDLEKQYQDKLQLNKYLEKDKDVQMQKSEELFDKYEKVQAKIDKIKIDIDRALQHSHDLPEMKKIVLDMCIQYLWNDYIFEDDLTNRDKAASQAAKQSENRSYLESEVLNLKNKYKNFEETYRHQQGQMENQMNALKRSAKVSKNVTSKNSNQNSTPSMNPSAQVKLPKINKSRNNITSDSVIKEDPSEESEFKNSTSIQKVSTDKDKSKQSHDILAQDSLMEAQSEMSKDPKTSEKKIQLSTGRVKKNTSNLSTRTPGKMRSTNVASSMLSTEESQHSAMKKRARSELRFRKNRITNVSADEMSGMFVFD